MSKLGDLAQIAEAIAENDRIHLWNTSAAEGSRDQFMDPAQLRAILLETSNTWTAAQTFNSNINVVGGIYLDNAKYIWAKDSGGTSRVVLFMTPDNHLDIGRQVQSGSRVDFTPGNSVRMSILASGRVGVGTVAPDTTLHVAGRMRSTGGMGWRYTKSIANSSATAIAEIGFPSNHILGSFLVTISLSGSGKRRINTYVVTVAYNVAEAIQLSTLAGIGVSTLTLSAAANSTTKVLTLSVTQVSGAAESVQVSVQPISIHDDEEVTFTGK